VAREGRLTIVFRDALGRKISMPSGIQLFQRRVDIGVPEKQRDPFGIVSFQPWEESITLDIFLKAGGNRAAEVGSLELTFREL
jgi:hypothetical protein